MAAQENTVKTNMTAENDTKAEMNTVMGWIFEYCCQIFWGEFQQDFTVDSASERRLLEGLSGIPMYSIQSTMSRNNLAHFVPLITRLADGPDYNSEYDDDSDDAVTPLEGAVEMLHKLVDCMEEMTQPNAVANLQLDIQTEAVLVCCRAGDYSRAKEVFQRLWDDEVLTKPQQRVKSTLDKVLKTKSIPPKLTWENFQKRTIANLRRLYDDMGVDEPFLQKAATRYLDAKKRRSSTNSISTQGQDNVTTHRKENEPENSRVIPLRRMEAVSRKRGCGSLETGDFNVLAIEKEFEQVRAKEKRQSASKKTPDRKRSKPVVSPIEARNNKEQPIVVDTSDDEVEMVTSTPHPHAVSGPSTGSSWKDKPSTSRESNPWRERPSIDRRVKQNGSMDNENKENSSPKRGKQIRDHVYQPGRVTRKRDESHDGSGQAATNKYIEWSSDEETDDGKPNIFKTHLPHKKVRKSLDLEEEPIRYHKIRRPAQRVPWTTEEEEKLHEGVAKFGVGKWAVIKQEYGFVIRTSVNLKDKWRNIEKDMKK